MILSRLADDARTKVSLAGSLSDCPLDFEQLLLADLDSAKVLVPYIQPPNSPGSLKQSLRGKIDRMKQGQGETERVRRLFSQLQRFEAPSPELAPIVAIIDGGQVEWPHIIAAIVASQGNLLPLLQHDYKFTCQAILNQAQQQPAGNLPGKPLTDNSVADFTIDLNDQAASFSELIGREEELGQLMAVLLRKRANNPVLIGEAGVGKTQIVEGLAVRLANGNVPTALKGKRIKSVDVARLVSGTKYRGEFEERIAAFLQYAKEQAGATIFFIDEIHNLMGLGEASGGMDAANLLKPALSRGELWCIGATTFGEFNKLEKDPAVRRRFQPIVVEEQPENEIREIIERTAHEYEQHHRVKFPSDTRDAIVRLARRYIGDVRSPAREIGLMDEVGAHFALDGRTDQIVKTEDFSKIISGRTGIPADRLQGEMLERIVNLNGRLKQQVFGQDRVIDEVDNLCRVSLAGLSDPKRPRALFFFAGPSGVGKTELAKAIARELYGCEEAMIRMDMSEFDTDTSTKKLIGGDPNYVGYEEGGRLTEAVRRKPFCLILLDEFEKAHPNVWRLFLQVFSDGRLTDGKGRTVNFREATIIMTSNVGSELLQLLNDAKHREDWQENFAARLQSVRGITPHLYSLMLEEADRMSQAHDADATRIVRTALLALPNFPPELFSRIGEPLVFDHLGHKVLKQILHRACCELVTNILQSRGQHAIPMVHEDGDDEGAIQVTNFEPEFTLTLSPETVRYLIDDIGNDPIVGGRGILNGFQRVVSPIVASQIIVNPICKQVEVHIQSRTRAGH